MSAAGTRLPDTGERREAHPTTNDTAPLPVRILYLTRVYPYLPVFGGEISYSRGVLECLAPACDLTVLAATNGAVPPGEHRADGVIWHVVPASRRISALSLLTTMPNVVWRNATRAYHDELARLLTLPWDCIILDHFLSAHVIDPISAWRRQHPDGTLLYLAHEHERTTRGEKYASYGGSMLGRAVMKLDGWKIGHWENKVLAAVDIVSLINRRERPLFESSIPGKRYITTTPGYDGERLRTRTIDASVPRRVTILGGRGSLHKQNILREWLAVASGPFAAAGIEMDVVGGIGASLHDELARRHPGVTFSGYVEGLCEHLQGSRLGIVPDTVGRGVKIRIPSYVFARVPMAGLAGAIDGLPLVAGRDYLEAQSPAALTQLCIRLVDDLPELNRLQNSAFAACDGALDWDDRARTIIEAVTARSGRDGPSARRGRTAPALA